MVDVLCYHDILLAGAFGRSAIVAVIVFIHVIEQDIAVAL